MKLKAEQISFEVIDGVPTLGPTQIAQLPPDFLIVDVRRPDEYVGELGHIAGAKLLTLGPELQTYLESISKTKPIIFVCRSGGRSGQATRFSREIGFERTFNMQGGMIAWNDLALPVEQN